MGTLIDDPELMATTFIVIDFEATTPRGFPPEPIEVAARAGRLQAGNWQQIGEFSDLMHPPQHAPLTAFDTEQTAITEAMLAGQPSADQVLARLDANLSAPPYLLVAHHASTEAGIIYRYRHACPRLAAAGLIDTIRLARHLIPGLHSYNLDVLIDHLHIPRPANRHRAMPDVTVTLALFEHLIALAHTLGTPPDLRAVLAEAGYQAKATQPVQETMF